MIFMIIFTMEHIRLLGSSVDPILVAMTSYLMVPIVKKLGYKYSQWRSFSESKPVPCINRIRKNDCPYWLVVSV